MSKLQEQLDAQNIAENKRQWKRNAAEEMYEALKRVVENKWEPDKYHMAVVEALRKAEGGQP